MKNSGLYRSLLLFLQLIMLSSGSLMAQVVSVHAQLDTNEIVIGDQVGLTIEVKKNKDDLVKFPEFTENLTDEIEIVSKTPLDSVWLKEERKVLLSQRLVLTVFDSGLYFIPPLKFLLVNQYTHDTINSRSNFLDVKPFPVDTANSIRDIKAIAKAPLSFTEVYPYILLFIFVCILVWFIFYVLRKKKNNQPIIGRSKIEEPAHIIAFRELDNLKSEKLWQRKEVKLYYSRLTEIIRRYIEKRFRIMAMEETSDEILVEFEGHELLSIEDFKTLSEMLIQADLVKFAKADPLPDENETHFGNAYKFITNTKFHEQLIITGNENDTVKNEITL